MRKSLIIILTSTFVLLACVIIYFLYLQPVKKNNPLIAVPADASIIFQLENPFEQWQELSDNDIWNYLKKDPYFAELGQEMDELTEDMRANEALYELIINRPMVMSIHKTRPDDYDFLYVIDLQRATQFNFIKNYIKNFSEDIEKVYTRNYKEQEIIEISFKDDPTRYYLYIYENLLSLSSTHTILEQSIDQIKEPIIARDLDFIDLSSELGTNDINMYINYRQLANYLKIWMADDPEASTDFFPMLKYSGMALEATDQRFSVSGYSIVNKEQPNLLTALMNAGTGEINVGTIVPDNASYFMSLGFDNSKDFYENMIAVLQAEEDGEEYMKSKEKIEGYLKISIEDDFLSWMDDEIALIQLNSNSNRNKVELAVAIKHNDLDDTKERLAYIEQQIRKKTPVKFKGIDYKGQQIHFLSIKGFFKMMFGKAFEGIDKPYYTIMEDYVVFSNSPRTLGKIIMAVQENRTLDNTKEYAVFMENFAYESNLFVYLSANELLSDAQRLLDRESRQELKVHSPYFKSFPMMGMQLSAEGDLLKHQLQANYLNHAEISSWNALIKEIQQDEVAFVGAEAMEEEDLIAAEQILPEDLNSKTFIEYYGNEQIKFEVDLKDGLKHGRYFEYDSLGNVIVKGRYRDDEKSGTWKFYDGEGELVKKERY
ncbi:DUF3352 domain-containing protein [Marivirga atlantica]|jgi:hypothetical protein|uniref:DUF3352 domain-containing protein n=1 Tax=Marivirga atlantica TaxID=1548457 RepID=A0A937A8M9_9BACT|nr:DUF3352 domain-containing protein [Marivirga atlantica]MBL0765625.1 DUF3352 domain-containing protein [Marivirga atlantica]